MNTNDDVDALCDALRDQATAIQARTARVLQMSPQERRARRGELEQLRVDAHRLTLVCRQMLMHGAPQ